MPPRRGPLPHERDETAAKREAEAPPRRRARIRRAADDVAAGREDTEGRYAPSNVPGPRAPAKRRA